MSDCCSPEKSASATEGAPQAKTKAFCPQCKRPGRTVSTLTLKHQVRPEFLTAVNHGAFYFCGTPECQVVYFSVGGLTLTKANVRRPITQKDAENAPVCYCFGFTPAMVREEIAASGKSTVVERIASEMKAGLCACEIRNPQGSCCLGNVKAVVKAALVAHGS
ncbi:MAG TPA: hypothetical protein VGD88_10930 [Opitutaceae bacterium]|jgi:hypothetical protein|nr:copper chaperone Copz family protein [Opitutaceae bacterium]MBI2512213.1 copper chaperone Copz family protein [Opitutae bacterium]